MSPGLEVNRGDLGAEEDSWLWRTDPEQALGTQPAPQERTWPVATTDDALRPEDPRRLDEHSASEWGQELRRSRERSGLHDQASPAAQARLDRALTRPDGTFPVHARPIDYARLINQGDTPTAEPWRADPGRSRNCLDCSMCMLSTWYGRPEASAPLRGNLDGESVERAEDWCGGEAQSFGSGRDGLRRVAEQVDRSGPGSSALVVVEWADLGGAGHAFTLHHGLDGQLVWCDPQRGLVGENPIYGGPDSPVGRVQALVLDPAGRPR